MNRFHTWVFVYCAILLLTLLTAYWGSRAVSVLAENLPSERTHTLVIDPGHGGLDGGAISCTGIPESRFNLEIGLRLNAFARFLGFQTVMTRTEDVSVYREGETISQKKASDLKERIRIIQETNNPILLSLHQNYYPEAQYSGLQVFYAKTPGSRELAQTVQNTFSRTPNSGNHRKEKEIRGVYLMEHISCPGILIECGFLSNPQEEAKLRNPDYQKKLCAGIICSLAEYFEHLTA